MHRLHPSMVRQQSRMESSPTWSAYQAQSSMGGTRELTYQPTWQSLTSSSWLPLNALIRSCARFQRQTTYLWLAQYRYQRNRHPQLLQSTSDGRQPLVNPCANDGVASPNVGQARHQVHEAPIHVQLIHQLLRRRLASRRGQLRARMASHPHPWPCWCQPLASSSFAQWTRQSPQ